ncbi:hypothetical protein FWH09_01920, partial [Candidatus Saccharibacteria bacterium]|nr:hypothetical protein [Candidatus Saccharibacteria bacterium]
MDKGKIRKFLFGVVAVIAITIGVGLRVSSSEDASAVQKGQWLYHSDGILIEIVNPRQFLGVCTGNFQVRRYDFNEQLGVFLSNGSALFDPPIGNYDGNCYQFGLWMEITLNNRLLTFNNISTPNNLENVSFVAPNGQSMSGNIHQFAFNLTVAQYNNSEGTVRYFCAPGGWQYTELGADCEFLQAAFYVRGSGEPRLVTSYNPNFNAGRYEQDGWISEWFGLAGVHGELRAFKEVTGVFAANDFQFLAALQQSFTFEEVRALIDEGNELDDTGIVDENNRTTASFDFFMINNGFDGLRAFALDRGNNRGYRCDYQNNFRNSYAIQTCTEVTFNAAQEFINNLGAGVSRTNLARTTVSFITGDMNSLREAMPANIPTGSVRPEIDPVDEESGTVSPDTGRPDNVDVDMADEGWARCNVGAFSWGLCPLFEMASGAADAAYAWIEGELQVQESDVSTLNNNELGGGTSVIATFRNMANIVFIILMMIAIISQLTGYGLSNYNIKRMLPRLIIVAILANLSFYIAQIAVDVSNIVGHQSYRLLNGMMGYIVPEGGGAEAIVANTMNWSFTILAIVAVGAVAFMWFSIGGVIMLIVTAAFAFLLFWGILVIRRVAILLLIALAPLAFVCLLLPSTEGLFRKWWSMLKVMLVIYPICGLLMGAGKLASVIVWNAGFVVDPGPSASAMLLGATNASDPTVISGTPGAMTIIVSLALTVVPFFAVVSLTKMSLNGLGSLGGKITGAMTGIRAWGSNKFAGSAVGQAAQADAAQKAQLRRQNSRIAQWSQRRALTKQLGQEGSARGIAHEKALRDIQNNYMAGAGLNREMELNQQQHEFDTGAGLGRTVALNEQKHILDTNAASTAAKDRLAEQKFGQSVSDAALRQQATLNSNASARTQALAGGHNRMTGTITPAMQNEFARMQARAVGEQDKQYASDLKGRVAMNNAFLKRADLNDINPATRRTHLEDSFASAYAAAQAGDSLALEALGEAMQGSGQGDVFLQNLSREMGAGDINTTTRNSLLSVLGNKEIGKNELASVFNKYYGTDNGRTGANSYRSLASVAASNSTASGSLGLAAFMSNKLSAEQQAKFMGDSDATKALSSMLGSVAQRQDFTNTLSTTWFNIAQSLTGAQSQSKANAALSL